MWQANANGLKQKFFALKQTTVRESRLHLRLAPLLMLSTTVASTERFPGADRGNPFRSLILLSTPLLTATEPSSKRASSLKAPKEAPRPRICCRRR